MSEEKSIYQKLLEIQQELKVEKGRYNSFGGFYSRSKEDILEAVKLLAHERGCVIYMNDEVEMISDGWVYIVSTASLVDVGHPSNFVFAKAVAREPETKPKMDASQVTGSASSYAGKRALGNLFALDDTADSDQMEPASEQADGQFTAACRSCGQVYRFDNLEHYRATKAAIRCCPNPMWDEL